MYKRMIEALQQALSEAEKVSGAGGDRWTDEIMEILEGVQRSAAAAEYQAKYKTLFKKHIPEGAEACFAFSNADSLIPSELLIEKGYICRRYPFDETAAEKSIEEAAERWRFDDMLAAI